MVRSRRERGGRVLCGCEGNAAEPGAETENSPGSRERGWEGPRAAGFYSYSFHEICICIRHNHVPMSLSIKTGVGQGDWKEEASHQPPQPQSSSQLTARGGAGVIVGAVQRSPHGGWGEGEGPGSGTETPPGR